MADVKVLHVSLAVASPDEFTNTTVAGHGWSSFVAVCVTRSFSDVLTALVLYIPRFWTNLREAKHRQVNFPQLNRGMG